MGLKPFLLLLAVSLALLAGAFMYSWGGASPVKPGNAHRRAGTKTPAGNWLTYMAGLLPGPTSTKITIDPKRWYQLTNADNGLDGLFDGITDTPVSTGFGKIVPHYEAYYPLLDGESMTLDKVRFYDFQGTFADTPMTLSVITAQWQRIPIATFTGDKYATWVGPYPDRQTTGDAQFNLDKSISDVRYLVIDSYGNFPTEIELYGAYTPPAQLATAAPVKPVRLGNMMGVNVYEWNFEDNKNPLQIDEPSLNVIKSFAGIRHYMDWNKLEQTEGGYSYNPTLSGGWNYDAIYQRCKVEGIDVLACLKSLPDWLLTTYPADQRDGENTPVRYGKDFTDPASYLDQAKVAFQYVARYGNNANVDPALLRVNTTLRWPGDTPNTVKTGLGVVHFIECDNERDKWWKGRKAYQTAREYAANLSAFYDGHKNSLGPGVGVKNADPTVQVVMAGLAWTPNGTDYLRGMIDWCKQYRGYKPDGSVNLCWDIINYHLYADNASSSQSGNATRGAAPEVTTAGAVAAAFRQVAHQQLGDMPVWVTETGYDINQASPIHALPIGPKSALDTQGDWILRTALLYARQGIEKVFFFQLYDDNTTGGRFGTSGLADGNTLTRRPAADYLYQTNKLFGTYTYKETLSRNPFVDQYERSGSSVYVLVVPDEVGRTASYTLDLGNATQARIYRPRAGSNDMDLQRVSTNQGKLQLTVTETPQFVLAGDAGPNTTPLITGRENPDQTIHVYPNPTGSFVTVQTNRTSDSPLIVRVFDSGQGHLYQETNIPDVGDQFTGKVDLSLLPAGMYLLEIIQGDQRMVRKILKVN